jgi:type IV fimbrial biogenesis protein FimT
MKRNRFNGFTLVELLLAIALMVVVLALAGPPFRELVLNNRRATQLNAMLSSLNLARAEAVKRGVRTVVCISDDAANPDCDASPTGWEQGWIAFVDGNRAGGSYNSLDNPADANGNGEWDREEDALLDVHGALALGTTLRGNNNVDERISFTRLTGTAGTLRHCDSRGLGEARGIKIAFSGRARVTTDTTGWTCP